MNKKRLVNNMLPEDLKGFEEFIDGQVTDAEIVQRGNVKKDTAYEHLTFLTNDSNRLVKQKNLLMNKIPFATQHEQGVRLIKDQQKEIMLLKKSIFEICNKPNSAYRKSMQEIFDSFFEQPKN